MFVGSLPKFNNNCSMDSLKLEQRCLVLFSLIVNICNWKYTKIIVAFLSLLIEKIEIIQKRYFTESKIANANPFKIFFVVLYCIILISFLAVCGLRAKDKPKFGGAKFHYICSCVLCAMCYIFQIQMPKIWGCFSTPKHPLVYGLGTRCVRLDFTCLSIIFIHSTHQFNNRRMDYMKLEHCCLV